MRVKEMGDDPILDSLRYAVFNHRELTEEQRKDEHCRYLYDEIEAGLECMKDYMSALAGNLDKDSTEYRMLSTAYWSLKGALEGVETSYSEYKGKRRCEQATDSDNIYDETHSTEGE